MLSKTLKNNYQFYIVFWKDLISTFSKFLQKIEEGTLNSFYKANITLIIRPE